MSKLIGLSRSERSIFASAKLQYADGRVRCRAIVTYDAYSPEQRWDMTIHAEDEVTVCRFWSGDAALAAFLGLTSAADLGAGETCERRFGPLVPVDE